MSNSGGDKVINIGCCANVTTACHGCIRLDVLCLNSATVSTSDCRSKCCITTSDLGLDFINALKPVKFKFRYQDEIFDDDGNLICSSDFGTRHVNQFSYGLLSQDVMKLLTDTGKTYEDFGGLIDDLQEPYTLNSKGKRLEIGSHEQAAKEPEKYWGQSLNDYNPDDPDGLFQKTQGLNYEQFIAPIVKAVQELSAKVTALEKG